MAQTSPGTYRIVNGAGNVVMTVLDHQWGVGGRGSSKLFAQSSGDGYRFKNCKYDRFLAVSSGDRAPQYFEPLALAQHGWEPEKQWKFERLNQTEDSPKILESELDRLWSQREAREDLATGQDRLQGEL
ncbi:hypothetical protein BDV93DRAFT_504552 [Ceratobasidium sp. AG-I]|nr:hypothetical protein BDV93DRAFT_504552 [Ceratobasidium sp. AG-I]